MNTMVEHINSAGKAFVEFALPMLVQSSVLIVILLLADLLLRKKVKAVFRYWIWMLVLVKLVLPTSLSSPLSLGYLFGDKLTYQDLAETTSKLETAESAPADTFSGINPLYIQPNAYIPPMKPVTSFAEPSVEKQLRPPAVPVTPLSWQGIVFLVWLAVVITMGLLLLQRALFVRGLVAQAKKAGRLMNDELAYCCASMRVKYKVGLKVSPNATTPSVCGLIRPVILVPWNLVSSLGASRLRTVLMHELAHIKRCDLWVNLAQTALQIIYFYNPLLWLANCVVRRIREQAVDEAVLVAMGERAQHYPQTLVDVAKMAFKRPALSLRLIGVVESESALAGRIKHILGRPMPKSTRLGLISILAIIVAGAILLPMARAQRQAEPETNVEVSPLEHFIGKYAMAGHPDTAAFEITKKGDVFIFRDLGGPKFEMELALRDLGGRRFEMEKGRDNLRFGSSSRRDRFRVRYDASENRYILDGLGMRGEVQDAVVVPLTDLVKISAEKPGDIFSATLPNGVKVELVGVSEHPSEGKQWWRPDGTPFTLPAGIKVEDTISRVGDNAFQFLFRYNSQEDLMWNSIDAFCLHFSIEGDSGVNLINFRRLPEGGQDGLIAKVAIFKEPLDSTTIQANLATGNWQTKAVRDISKIDQRSEDLYWYTSESAGHTKVEILHRIEKQQIKTVAIDREGNEYRASYSLGSFNGWASIPQIDGRRYVASLRKDDRLVKFKLQSRPFWSSVIGNVSLKPNFKTDVQVESDRSVVEAVLDEAIEAAREGISLPIRKIFSAKTDKGGSFEWETSIDPRIRFRHGWYSVEDGMVREHVGGGSQIPDEGKLNLKLDVEVKDNMLNLKVQRVHDLDDGSRTEAVASKTPVPAGAYLKHVNSIDTAVLTNKHLNLWRGDFIRDGKVVKSVIYAAYLTTPDDRETGFKPPVLQKGEIVTAKVGPDVQLGIESTISPKLVMLLDAINSCTAETDLNIDSISITGRNISIKGNTSGRTNTRKFLDAVKDDGLKVSQLSLGVADNRDKFSIIVEPAEDWQKWWQQRKTDVQLGFEETVSPKLIMLLVAIKSVAAEMDLNIESISVTARSMSIEGDTSGRTGTLKFLDAIKDNGLEVSRLNLDERNNRDRFRITVEPKKDWRQWWQQHRADVQVKGEYNDELYQKQDSIKKALEFIGTPEELIDTTFVSKHGQLANSRQLKFANKLFSIRKSKDVDMFISLLSDGSKKQLNDGNNRRMLHRRIKNIKNGTFLYGEYDCKFFATFREFTEKDRDKLKKHVIFPEPPTHAIAYWHFHKPNYMVTGSSYYLIEDKGSYKFVAQTLLSDPVIPAKKEQSLGPEKYGIVAFKQNDDAYTQRGHWKYQWDINLTDEVSENNVFQVLKTTKVISGQADLHPEIAAQKIIDESWIEKYKYEKLKCRFYVGASEQAGSGWLCGLSIAGTSKSTSMLFPGKDVTNVKPNRQGNFVGSDLEILSFETSDGNIKYQHKVILRKDDSPEAKSAALLRLEQMTRRQISKNKLQYLGGMLTSYANDHNSKYPDMLVQIKPYDTDEWLDWLLENIEYLGKCKTLTETSKTVIAYDKTLLEEAGSTNVLFNEGPVQYCDPNWLKKLGIMGYQKPDVPVEEEKGWGEVVEGVQCRLRSDKMVWKESEIPTFKADVRNRGLRRLELSESQRGNRQVEVDGRWYLWDPRSRGSRIITFEPGQVVSDLFTSLSGSWQRAEPDELDAEAYSPSRIWLLRDDRTALELTTGEHIVRVAFIAHPARANTGGSIRLVSNPVEIEILPEQKPDVHVEAEPAGKLEEGPSSVSDYSDLKESIKTAYKARSELLLNSTGTANIVFETKEYNMTSFEPSGSAADSATWTTKWYKKGGKNRYDIYVPTDSRSRRLPRPQDIRTAQDPNKRIYYDAIQGKAYIDKPNFKSGNPFGLSKNFDVTWLYQFTGKDVPYLLAAMEETGHLPKITEDRIDRVQTVKLDYDYEYVSKLGNRIRREVQLWFAPEMAYSLIKAEFFSQHGEKLDLVEGYKAAYEESGEFEGVWLMKEVMIISNQSNFSSNSERLTATFHNTKVGLDIPDKIFTFEGLGVPPGAKIYDKRFLVWGQIVYGLRAALEFVPEKEAYSIGEQIGVRFHVHNTTGEPIQFISETWRQDDKATVEDEQGNLQPVGHTWYSGRPRVERYYLKPGEQVVLESSAFGIAANSEQAEDLGHPVGCNLICKPGIYSVSYSVRLPDIRSSSLPPQENDWEGVLQTGKRKLVVTAAIPPELSEFPPIVFERIADDRGANKPMFVDVDTGRIWSPSFSLTPADVQKPVFLPNLACTKQLRDWVRRHGIDVAVQTDGKVIALMGMDMRAVWQLNTVGSKSESLTPSDVINCVKLTGADKSSGVVTFADLIDSKYLEASYPVITREGGVAVLEVAGLTDLRGPNGIRIRYKIVRLPQLSLSSGANPNASNVTTMVGGILGPFEGFLCIDIDKNSLRLRSPDGQQLVVMKDGSLDIWSNGELIGEAARLNTGVIDFDAERGEITVFGRGCEAVVKLDDGLIRAQWTDGKLSETKEGKSLNILLPEIEIMAYPDDKASEQTGVDLEVKEASEKNRLFWGEVVQTDVPVEGEQGDESPESKVTEPAVKKPVGHRGRITGVVVSSVTGQPIAGAYVGVGDFGDSGGSNYARHREQGLHSKTETDAEGRFELNGLVFTDKHRYLKYHPLVVTHPDFVRHDEKIELLSSGPAPDVKVSLRPAAKIDVTIVDADGNPLPGHWLIRLEALDGRRFIPPGSDPHLSYFASNIWAHWPDLRTQMGVSNGFTFTELDTGEYSIEALKFQLVDNPTPGNIWKPIITYHGSIPSIRIQAGQAKQVQLLPQDHQTRLTITHPEYPDKLMDKLERSSRMPLMCLISRSPGALLWDDGKIRHLEDQRLGRIDQKRFFRGFFIQDKPLTINNLPPDSYSLFTLAVYGQVAGYLIGARADLAKGDDITVDIPWRQPTGPSMFGPNRSFDYPVNLEAKDYGLSELCGILTEITRSNPRIIADSSIENERIRFGKVEMSVWDVLEKLYLDKGWKLGEVPEKALILEPKASSTAKKHRVYLPDLETPRVNVILDLATGEMLQAMWLKDNKVAKLGKGDVVYEYSSNRSSLLCLRGATMQLRTNAGLSSLKVDIQREYFAGYFLTEVPCQYQVATAEGDKYELRVISVDKGETGGAFIQFWKSEKQKTDVPVED